VVVPAGGARLEAHAAGVAVRTWLEIKPPMVPLLALMDPGEFLMMRKHLLGVKARAEALAGSA